MVDSNRSPLHENTSDDNINNDAEAAMKEAYRNVAANLAASAWGEDGDNQCVNSPGTFRNAGTLGRCNVVDHPLGSNNDATYRSAFEPVLIKRDVSSPDLVSMRNERTSQNHEPIHESFNRSPKVAKASYTDHGYHAERFESEPNRSNHESNKDKRNPRSLNVLKNVIYMLEETFDGISKNLDKNKNLQSEENEKDMRNHDNLDTITVLKQKEHVTEAPLLRTNHFSNRSSPQKSSRLQAALNSSTMNTTPIISETRKTDYQRGKCLSSPSKPASNNGLDNIEGNLIVYVNDILSIPRHTVKYHSSKTEKDFKRSQPGNNETIDFLIIDILGQGTFAQVFKCKNLLTNELMALKIVKSKPAYTRQSMIEIDVFQSLSAKPPVNFEQKHQQLRYRKKGNRQNTIDTTETNSNMVDLLCYFLYHSHLCLAFELLGSNLYEVLKKRQFRGLSISVVQSLVRQAVTGVKKLSQHSIVHCDLKPENILLTCKSKNDSRFTTTDQENRRSKHWNNDVISNENIKLIDFGSACFEGQTAHTYIQSRFYRSPEVLVGLSYDSAIDMWSLGCVAAELFLGLPILPGVHEHDQLCRICEMISPIPRWMIEQGSKSDKYFSQIQGSRENKKVLSVGKESHGSQIPSGPKYRLKTRQEYISCLSEKERGNHEKLDQQPNRYFKRKRLSDIVSLHGINFQDEDKVLLRLFVHLLKGILDPDPWKRWTAHQASTHPFVTGIITESHRKSKEFYWSPPWDPSICHRKLLSVSKAREKHLRGKISGNLSNSMKGPAISTQHSLTNIELSPETNSTSRVTAMAESMSLSHAFSTSGMSLPAGHTNFGGREFSPPPLATFANMPTLLHHSYQQRLEISGSYPLQPQLPERLSTSHHQESRIYIHPRVPHPNFNSNASTLSNINPIGRSMVDAQYSPAIMIHPTGKVDGLIRGYGDNPYSMQHYPAVTGPQSFSGVYYDRTSQHLPVEGDLGYALQRPGVVPSMGSEQTSSMSQKHSKGYRSQHNFVSNDNFLNNHNRNGAFSGLPPGTININHNTRLSPQTRSSHSLSTNFPQDHTEQHKTASGYSINDNNLVSRSKDPSNENEGRGLLAQQLEAHSAAMKEPKKSISDPSHTRSGVQNSHQPVRLSQNHHLTPALYQEPKSLGSTSQPYSERYYNYASSNPPPLILSSTAPSITDPAMPPYYYPNIGYYKGSHGSLQQNDFPGKVVMAEGRSFPSHYQLNRVPPPYPILDEIAQNNGGYVSSNNEQIIYSHIPPPTIIDRGTSS